MIRYISDRNASGHVFQKDVKLQVYCFSSVCDGLLFGLADWCLSVIGVMGLSP